MVRWPPKPKVAGSIPVGCTNKARGPFGPLALLTSWDLTSESIARDAHHHSGRPDPAKAVTAL